MYRTILFLLLGLSLFWLVGCSAVIKTGQLDVTLDTKPAGMATIVSNTPGLDLKFDLDPWLAIEKAIEGIAGLFRAVSGLPAPVTAGAGSSMPTTVVAGGG